MGFFDEIKKVVFGVKSVSKSAADKVMDKGRDAVTKSGEYIDKTRDKVEDMTEGLGDKAENAWNKAIDSAENIGAKVIDKTEDLFDGARDFTENIGGKVINRADDLFDDAKDIVEDLGEKILDSAGRTFQKAKDLSGKTVDEAGTIRPEKQGFSDFDTGIDKENIFDSSEGMKDTVNEKADALRDELKTAAGLIGEKVSGLKSDLVEKAKILSDKLSDKLDETLHKAENMAKSEDAQSEFREHGDQLRKSVFDDKDDFFKKAEAFADGRYDAVSDPFSQKAEIIGKAEIQKKPGNQHPLAGFEDLDGDGNEIIDDALIDSDE